jgi:hypothetical protein
MPEFGGAFARASVASKPAWHRHFRLDRGAILRTWGTKPLFAAPAAARFRAFRLSGRFA